MIGALDRKLLRDLGRLWAQVLAVALVMACGVMTIVVFIGANRTLEETRAAFYERYLFASVFASANRAPERLRGALAAIEGVAAVETRIVKTLILEKPMTLEQVGQIIGVTKERVRQIQNKAMEKIRAKLETGFLGTAIEEPQDAPEAVS